MTPFARLVLFLVIFLPLAYFGAAYYNNEDPLQNLKNIFNKEQTSSTSSNGDQTYNGQSEIERLRTENAQLKRRVEELEAQVKQLQGQSSSNSNRETWGNNN